MRHSPVHADRGNKKRRVAASQGVWLERNARHLRLQTTMTAIPPLYTEAKKARLTVCDLDPLRAAHSADCHREQIMWITHRIAELPFRRKFREPKHSRWISQAR